jgi:hypothetical protein
MHHIEPNFWAILVAAVVKFFIGMIWYAPPVFGTTWMKLTQCTPEKFKARMGKIFAGDLIGNFVMAFVLTLFVRGLGATSALQGASVGFHCWLGFVAVVTLTFMLYEQRPFKLFLINNGFQLISLMAMGAILAVWV